MKKRHGEVISKTGLIIGLLSLSLAGIAGQAHAAIQCYDCHGDRSTQVLKPKDTYLGAPTLRDASTGAFLGNHQTHLGNAPSATDCVKCHNNQNYANSHAKTANYQIQINPKLNSYSSALGKAAYGKPTFFNQTSMPTTSNCSNVNCHFGSSQTDQWGTVPYSTSDNTTCNKCHNAIPTTFAHTTHISKYGNNLASCANCHTNHTAEAKPFQHATSAGRAITVTNGYTGSNNAYLPGQTGRLVGTCSAASCHANVYGTGSVTTPGWGTSNNGCSACHTVAIGTTGPATGSHAKHNVTDCTQCHAAGTTATTMPTSGHLDGSITVTDGYPATAKHAAGTYTGTCSTASCHSNVYGTGSATTPVWGSTGNGCSACHSVAIGATGPATGSHVKHNDANCVDCHAAGTTATTVPSTGHADGTITVTDGYPVTAKHAAGTYAGTCSTASCHANVYGTGTVASPVWGTSAANCTACHTVAIGATGPATGSHVKHNVTDCTQCHAAGTTATTMPSTGHLNGTITVTDGYPVTAKHAQGTYTGTCSTASCHANVYGTGSATTPVWGTTAANCTACHTVAIGSTGPATGSHVKHNDTNCVDCHAAGTTATTMPSTGHIDGSITVTDGYPVTAKHAQGSYTGTCSTASCHANVYGTGSVATPVWGVAAANCTACHSVSIATTGPATGSHAKHNDTNCSDCHTGATNSTTLPTSNHINGSIDVAGGYPATAKHAQGTYTGTCSTASCHANVYGTGTVTTPVWGSTGNGCSACHTVAIGATGPATGSHAKHNDTNCVDCHAAGTTATTVPSSGHANGTINVTDGYPVTAKHTAGTYTGTCSTAACHDNGRGVSVVTPVWGTSAPACTACHSLQPNTGSHTKHLTGLTAYNRNAACGDCHTGALQGSNGGTQHLDGNVDVAAGTGYPQNVAKHNDNNFGSCTTVACHSNGRGTYNAVQWGTTNSAGCNLCHPNLSAAHLKHVATIATATYGNTANSTTDAAYDFGCGNCHPIATSNHMDGLIELTLNSTHGGPLKSKNNVTVDNSGYTQNTGVSVTCSAAYCHSTGYAANLKFVASPDWYGTYSGDKCAMCHGNSPNSDSVNKPGSPAHTAHAVGIHYDDIFNGVSGKYGYYSSASKPSAHGDPNQATIISCDICHSDTVITAAAGKNANDKNSICVTCHSAGSRTPDIKRAAHINGTVNVKFAAVNVRSKAQIRDASFSSYSAVWSRTTYKVDSGSYDTAKKALNQASFTAGPSAGQGTCATVSCHNGYTVNWNDSLTCDNCHSRL